MDRRNFTFFFSTVFPRGQEKYQKKGEGEEDVRRKNTQGREESRGSDKEKECVKREERDMFSNNIPP